MSWRAGLRVNSEGSLRKTSATGIIVVSKRSPINNAFRGYVLSFGIGARKS